MEIKSEKDDCLSSSAWYLLPVTWEVELLIFRYVSVALFMAGAAVGQSLFDETKLFGKGAWEVRLTHNTEAGSLWCSASTRNRSGQEFSITAYQNSTLALFIFDNRWNISPRDLRFLIDVDYSRWTVDGNGDGISVSIAMTDPEKSWAFLLQIMEGSAVAVMNTEETRLATFSLSGSHAAITNLFSCWKRIGKQDPFKTNSDPFN